MARGLNPARLKRGLVPYVDLTISLGGAANEVDITVQLKDSDERDVNEVVMFNCWTASDVNGATLANDPTSAHGDGGSGYLIGTMQSTAHGAFLTDTTGEAVVTVTDTGSVANRFVVEDPRTGLIHVTRNFASADFGS